ncbi:MAG: tRNA (N(6)-L-threonylcarbamoyladenosine(37)-C(2))-methylthiotransferase MtaB [Clostridia bacterium]|nr:tRNA (N(6)-L-threonylcarbamoyladenosine(37)-C(2))-methylthiotransferase MtaB [Clostridia bacterium]
MSEESRLYSVGLYTLGCKVSQYETEAIGEAFERRGFTVGRYEDENDVYLINTCTVTAESDRKSRQMIRRAIKKNPDAVVIVVGCYSQRSPGEVAKIEGVSAVLGSADKLSAVDIAISLLANREAKTVVSVSNIDEADFEPMCITRAPRTRAYVKIEDGCECRCSYCAIPSARGRVRSKAREDVISEVEWLYASGVREIVLTGIETASYGKDFDEPYSLADLIVELDCRKSCERLRLGSLAPELINEEFINKVKKTEILAPHFHLSMQSGSDTTLRRMRRRYNTAMAERNIALIREAFPTAHFTTDMMVGFPGESEADFLETVDFVRRIGFLDTHVFAYSRRERTPAADFDSQIDEAVKRERSERLIRVKCEVRDKILDNIVKQGEPARVILENYRGGAYSAHSDNFVEYSVKAEEGLTGEMRKVRPVSRKGGVIYAEII